MEETQPQPTMAEFLELKRMYEALAARLPAPPDPQAVASYSIKSASVTVPVNQLRGSEQQIVQEVDGVEITRKIMFRSASDTYAYEAANAIPTLQRMFEAETEEAIRTGFEDDDTVGC